MYIVKERRGSEVNRRVVSRHEDLAFDVVFVLANARKAWNSEKLLFSFFFYRMLLKF